MHSTQKPCKRTRLSWTSECPSLVVKSIASGLVLEMVVGGFCWIRRLRSGWVDFCSVEVGWKFSETGALVSIAAERLHCTAFRAKVAFECNIGEGAFSLVLSISAKRPWLESA